MTAADRHDLEYALKLLDASKPECRGYLWNHYVIGFDYGRAPKQTLDKPHKRPEIEAARTRHLTVRQFGFGCIST